MPIFSNKHYWALMNKLTKIEEAVAPKKPMGQPLDTIYYFRPKSLESAQVEVGLLLSHHEWSEVQKSDQWKDLAAYLGELGIVLESIPIRIETQRPPGELETQ